MVQKHTNRKRLTNVCSDNQKIKNTTVFSQTNPNALFSWTMGLMGPTYELIKLFYWQDKSCVVKYTWVSERMVFTSRIHVGSRGAFLFPELLPALYMSYHCKRHANVIPKLWDSLNGWNKMKKISRKSNENVVAKRSIKSVFQFRGLHTA